MANVKFNLVGIQAGTFFLYSNVDGYSIPFGSGITIAQILNAFPTAMIPVGTTTVRVVPEVIGIDFLSMALIPITTTTTSTVGPTTTTSTTTIPVTTTTTTTL